MKLSSLTAIARHPMNHLRQAWLQWGAHWWWNHAAPWMTTIEGRQRCYYDYDQYLRHQASKWFWHKAGIQRAYAFRLAEYMQRLMPWTPVGASVLCLGARDGTEVEVFRHLGCFAWGVDIAYPKQSSTVVYMDFHKLTLPPSCVDVVYTNSLDHAYDLNAIAIQVQRVLKPSGWWWVDAHTNGQDAGAFESQDWGTVAKLQERLEAMGWLLVKQSTLEPGMTSMKWVYRGGSFVI